VTDLLADSARGNKAALDEMLPLVYAELRRLAESYLRHERPDHTLQPTALVHEAYMRLIGQRNVDWHNRAHFLGIAAQTMRRLLVNHAEAHRAAKRGGGMDRITLDPSLEAASEPPIDVLALDHAIGGLTEIDSLKGQIVELRYFGGLTIDEIAEFTERSAASVNRDLQFSRAWLRRELTRQPGA
jgi:RNA polymerase sigma factor (TIGR02999 family)